MTKHHSLATTLALSCALFALADTVEAQLGTLDYSQDFDADSTANWVTFTNGVGQAGSEKLAYADFYFDYSTVGIPSAPHSSGGTTRGMKLGAGLGPVSSGLSSVNPYFPSGISVCPLGYSIANNFDMHFDCWMNFNKSGTGTTVVGGAGYGTAATSCQDAGASLDCVLAGVTLDGGSSADWRVYGSAHTGSYQDTDHVITGNTNTPYVYPPASRNNTAPYYNTNFPAHACPVAQTNLFPRQTGASGPAGTMAFGWHDVSVSKIGRTIYFKVDGILCAQANQDDAGAQGGNSILFNIFDTNGNENNDPDGTNLCFILIDNVRITNFPSIVTVQATTPDTSEATPGSPGVFTITRSQNNGQPMTVNYTLTGTATNGIQYQTVPTSVTIAATESSTNINIVPIDDGIPNVTTLVTLTILPGANYVGAGFDTVSIADNDTPTVDINSGSQAYGRYANDFINFTAIRRGKLTTGADLSVNLGYGGSAVAGTDYVQTNTITIPDGAQSASFQVFPLYNAAITTNRTVSITAAPGTGYSVGTGPGIGTIVTPNYPPAAALLLSNALNNASDAGNWKILYGCGDPDNYAADYEANFGMLLTSAAGGVTIPPPPNGAANALHLTCNKDATPGVPGAVNVYYTNLWLSGDYAVRFSMNIIEGQTLASATEGAIFGINHTGSQSNWWFGSGFITNTWTWGSDGIWYFVTAQAAGNGVTGDYQEYTGTGGTNGNSGWTRLSLKNQTSFADVFKENPGPFTSVDANSAQTAGIPANGSPVAFDASAWSDVEIKQQNNVVTLSINKAPVFVYTNTTVWTNGYLMLGYSDPYGGSIGAAEAGVYYSDLQVVQLPVTTPPVITISSITISGGNVVIKFTTSSAADTASSFSVRSSATVAGAYSDVSPAANITSLGSNQFQATTPYTGGTLFYRVHHN